jgi:surface polysaccharide O-acyltransferase-like enzyme
MLCVCVYVFVGMLTATDQIPSMRIARMCLRMYVTPVAVMAAGAVQVATRVLSRRTGYAPVRGRQAQPSQWDVPPAAVL